MILRNWESTDNLEVLALECECFSDPWTLSMFEGLFASPLNSGIVAEDDGKIVGYICVAYNYFEVEILNVAVKKQCRRKKIGEALMKWAVDLAKGKNAESLFLEVRASNEPAKGLYKKTGFKEVGLRRGYYGDGEDAVLMCLSLGEEI